MSSGPEDMSFDFEIEAEPRYVPDEIAERVLWPVVNRHWGSDFQAHSGFGDKVEISKSRQMAGAEYSASILARNEAGHDKEAKVSELSLSLGRTVGESLANMIFFRALEEDADVDTGTQQYIDTEELDELRAKIETMFVFNTEGDFLVARRQAIVDKEEDLIWASDGSHKKDQDDEDDEEHDYKLFDEPSDEEMVEITLQQQLYKADIDLIKLALKVLRSPKGLAKTLAAIKDNPLT